MKKSLAVVLLVIFSIIMHVYFQRRNFMRKPLAIALLLIGGAALKIALSVSSAVKIGKVDIDLR